jgi:hypothetical protein
MLLPNEEVKKESTPKPEDVSTSDDKIKDYESRLQKAEAERLIWKNRATKAEDEIYTPEYLEYMKGGEEQKSNPLKSYSEDQLASMTEEQKIGLIARSVYQEIKNEQDKEKLANQSREHKTNVKKAEVEMDKFAKDNPEFWNYAMKVAEISEESPRLNLEQCYALANPGYRIGGKKEDKPKEPPDTKPKLEGGIRKEEDKNKSLRDVIVEEYHKRQQ